MSDVIRLGAEERDVPVPPGVNEALREYGGLNVHGDARFRCVWSNGRREVVCGEWSEWDGKKAVASRPTEDGHLVTGISPASRRVLEAREVLKYPTIKSRFILEEWCPPEKYGPPSAWPEELGPYPSRGDYELVKVCEACRDDCASAAACRDAGHIKEFYAPDAAWSQKWITGFLHFRESFDPAKQRAAREDMRAKRELQRQAQIKDKIASLRAPFGVGTPWVQVQGGRDDLPTV